MKKLFICVAISILIGLPACKKEGAVERAGERVDEVIDNVKEGEAPLKKKGPIEKMGESIDETFSGDKD